MKRKLHYCFWIALYLIFGYGNIMAQQPLNHKKGSYVDSLNRYYQQAALPVYLYISTEPNLEEAVQLAKDNGTKKPSYVAIYLDGPGRHTLNHYDHIDKKDDRFYIYADGYTPKTKSEFKTAQTHTRDGVRYYGKGLTVDLSTSDDMSGIEELYQSVNEASFTPYSKKEMVFDKEQAYSLKYYAVDHVGNAEEPIEETFVVDHTHPTVYHVVNGLAEDHIISGTSKVYLQSSDSLSGVDKVYYKFDLEEEFRVYSNKSVETAKLDDGDHELIYYAVDKVGNRTPDMTFKFYLDKTAPITAADVLGDRYVVDGQLFFSGRSKLKLTAVDNKSGVRAVLYSVDGSEYAEYDQPFYLPAVAGTHTVKYYSVDNMANEMSADDKMHHQYMHNVSKVYLDLTGPTLYHAFKGDIFDKEDTIYISSRTLIDLKAQDPESGLQYISYNLDGATDETKYMEAFSLEKEGAHSLEMYGYDNVNNRNKTDFSFVVDNQGPAVFEHFSVKTIGKDGEYELYPSYVSIFLAATDEKTGYKKMYYSINGGQEKTYLGVIDGFKRNKKYNIKVRAFDKLNNETVYEFSFKTARKRDELSTSTQ